MILNTDNKLYHLVRAIRPRQWIKNFVIFAPLTFHGELLNLEYFSKTLVAFFYFCGIASTIYLINDIFDQEKDRLHPVKKNRPIASGALPVSWAWTTAIILILFLIPTSFLYVGRYFGMVLVSYLVLQFAYNLKLKEVIIIDAITIAGGFILRAFAGALAIPISISSWLILAITGASLLLAFGKRRAERTLLEAKGLNQDVSRSILRHYPDSLLDSMISVSASICIVTYSLFTFHNELSDNITPELNKEYLQFILPPTLVGVKFLMITIPIVIYSVARYLYVIYEKREGESPERVLINDRPLLAAVVLWTLTVIFISGAHLI